MVGVGGWERVDASPPVVAIGVYLAVCSNRADVSLGLWFLHPPYMD